MSSFKPFIRLQCSCECEEEEEDCTSGCDCDEDDGSGDVLSTLPPVITPPPEEGSGDVPSATVLPVITPPPTDVSLNLFNGFLFTMML